MTSKVRKGERYTEKELYEFVWRADTPKKVAIAEEWLKAHVNDNELFDDLMIALSTQYRQMNPIQLKNGETTWFQKMSEAITLTTPLRKADKENENE